MFERTKAKVSAKIQEPVKPIAVMAILALVTSIVALLVAVMRETSNASH